MIVFKPTPMTVDTFTGKLRWHRESKHVMALQQQVKVTTYLANELQDVRYEWRDVPETDE